jgi:hypothetical protein
MLLVKNIDKESVKNEIYVKIGNTGCIKKTEQIWNCSQLRKTAICIQFLIYIVSLDTYN